MSPEEIRELTEMKSKENCCIFCQSKCPKCGSVNIEVDYYRRYELNNGEMRFDESLTFLVCDECDTKSNGFYVEGFEDFSMKQVISKQRNDDLSRQVDRVFSEEPIKLDENLKKLVLENNICNFEILFSYNNKDRNHICIDWIEEYCEDKDGNIGFAEIAGLLGSFFTASLIELKCEDAPDKSHYVLEATHLSLSLPDKT